jgi:hypothetical protein
MEPLDINTPLTVTMTAGEWNQVLAQLAEQPYKLSAPLITKIQNQAMSQAPPALSPSINGAAEGVRNVSD